MSIQINLQTKQSIERLAALAIVKKARNEALAALTYDFGDGRVMQTREKDKAKVETAIELMGLSDQKTTEWVMVDDVKYSITAIELSTAMLAGKIAAAAIWADYEPVG